ncbi:acetyltransferase (GNAT) family protein [Chitinophaga skermanii]|uniref:Acetyltransferase (GNAT) family protein n=1 Tax=Chitinophaga skermanii TaxID=331697 RepID=A0A327QZ33_9BACT|nr:GNAT family N-acetyltransferase [Chitinophaga skermanii]RAJ08902.1 acetyltransferase (GNAT) family protein [Chitinophaga skermanii]
MNIKLADINDLQHIVPLFNAYRVFYKQPSDITGAEAFVRERLQNGDSKIYLAFIDGKAAGFTQLYPIFSSVSMGKAWLLNDLYVDADCRKRGVGKALLDMAKALGAEQQAKWIMLQTDTTNTTAQKLYEDNDFEKDHCFTYFHTIKKEA